jgi:hypothetical protein|tara:strand:+ start:1146 stop:1430 length:285 start_codon:yes stop_codon:yes gene_type:complete
LLHLIITISLGVVSLFLLITIFYALRRINAYEQIILKISSTVELINIQLKTIDDKGTFESDDEVGFFFTELKQLGNELEQLFETEVDDASKKEA